MHKDQYTDAPSQEQVRVKTMLNSTISMGYPDVVIACIGKVRISGEILLG